MQQVWKGLMMILVKRYFSVFFLSASMFFCAMGMEEFAGILGKSKKKNHTSGIVRADEEDGVLSGENIIKAIKWEEFGCKKTTCRHVENQQKKQQAQLVVIQGEYGRSVEINQPAKL